MSHGIFESCACETEDDCSRNCSCNCHTMSAEEILPVPFIESVATRYEQALARIEREIEKRKRNIDHECNSYRVELLMKELSAWTTLKAVLELHGPVDYGNGVFLCDAEETCWGCAEWSATSRERSVCCQKFPCLTAEKIIEGVGIAQ